MSQNSSEDLRTTAELFINQTRCMQSRGAGNPSGFDITRTHSINLITEEFLAGYMQDGRMSVIRRFFCLFVTFDLFFVSLLWLICIMVNGDSIIHALQKEILHYTANESLFDVVAAAICRFLILIFFYAFLYVNHWLIVALSTSGSCFFLLSKVFVFDWVGSSQQAFVVILILSSFILAWGEAWFLDCRVIPQERHARRYFSGPNSSDRSPLMAPFLASQDEHRPPESVANFYSLLDSAHNSDDEEGQDEEYHQMGLDCLRKAYDLLQVSDWKVEKVTKKGDTISSLHRERLGKIYKLTGRLKYPAKALCKELFYKIEETPHWNPTVLESKIIRKINTYTDISYQATVGGGGGFIKPRDFVNLRCWRLFVDGKIYDDNGDIGSSDDDEMLSNSCEGSVSTISDRDEAHCSSVGSCRNTIFASSQKDNVPFPTLSKSLGAKDFSDVIRVSFNEPPPLDEEFEDAEDQVENEKHANPSTQSPLKEGISKGRVWLNAAISVDYDKVPANTKYTRGENLVAGFAMHEMYGKSDSCIIEWILCIDLKGYMPRYVLDAAYATFMTDYMKHLRKYISELRQRHRKVHRN